MASRAGPGELNQALTKACKRGDVVEVKRLLGDGADVNLTNVRLGTIRSAMTATRLGPTLGLCLGGGRLEPQMKGCVGVCGNACACVILRACVHLFVRVFGSANVCARVYATVCDATCVRVRTCCNCMCPRA